MSVVTPLPAPKPRHKVDDSGESIRLTISSGKKGSQTVSKWITVANCLIVTAAFVGTLIQILPSELWLGISLGFLFNLFLLLMSWLNTREEVIVITSKSIIANRQPLLGFSRSQIYLAEHINNLRLFSSWSFNNARSASGGGVNGPLGFNYGARTYFFGMGIPEEEAQPILLLIQQKFPQFSNPKRAQQGLAGDVLR